MCKIVLKNEIISSGYFNSFISKTDLKLIRIKGESNTSITEKY